MQEINGTEIDFRQLIEDSEFADSLPARLFGEHGVLARYRSSYNEWIYKVGQCEDSCPECKEDKVLYNSSYPQGNFIACINCLYMGVTQLIKSPITGEEILSVTWRKDLGRLPQSLNASSEFWGVTIAWHYAKWKKRDLANESSGPKYFII